MEKKFKNQLAIKGPVSLKRAFIEELNRLGYSQCPSSIGEFSYPDYPVQVNQYGGNGNYGIWSNLTHTNCNPIILNLPQDWDKALQLASETEEVVPEYVKLVRGWSVGGEYMGEVFELKSLDNLSKFKHAPKKEDFRKLITEWIKEGYFALSSLAEYKQQQNAPKYKVGDFYSHNGDLRYITKIKDGAYHFTFQISKAQQGQESSNYIPSVDGINGEYKRVSDEEALQLLKTHYAKQGIVEGARVTWGTGRCSYEITQLDLVKRTSLLSLSDFSHGNSQLAIFTKTGGITPTTDGFKVLPKEVKVAGYPVEIKEGIVQQGKHTLIKIGCQWYTRDSLITIRDLIIHGHNGAHTFAHFSLSNVGPIKVTVDELNAAIELFDK